MKTEKNYIYDLAKVPTQSRVEVTYELDEVFFKAFETDEIPNDMQFVLDALNEF